MFAGSSELSTVEYVISLTQGIYFEIKNVQNSSIVISSCCFTSFFISFFLCAIFLQRIIVPLQHGHCSKQKNVSKILHDKIYHVILNINLSYYVLKSFFSYLFIKNVRENGNLVKRTKFCLQKAKSTKKGMIVHACNQEAEIGVHHRFEIAMVFIVSTRPAGKYEKTLSQSKLTKKTKTNEIKLQAERQEKTYTIILYQYVFILLLYYIIHCTQWWSL